MWQRREREKEAWPAAIIADTVHAEYLVKGTRIRHLALCGRELKGANFRNLPGVIVKDDNRVMLDPDMERVLLPSGKPLVPDYAITFVEGRSSKPFAHLWWDETVPAVVTRAEPHNQAILHPEQAQFL